MCLAKNLWSDFLVRHGCLTKRDLCPKAGNQTQWQCSQRTGVNKIQCLHSGCPSPCLYKYCSGLDHHRILRANDHEMLCVILHPWGTHGQGVGALLEQGTNCVVCLDRMIWFDQSHHRINLSDKARQSPSEINQSGHRANCIRQDEPRRLRGRSLLAAVANARPSRLTYHPSWKRRCVRPRNLGDPIFVWRWSLALKQCRNDQSIIHEESLDAQTPNLDEVKKHRRARFPNQVIVWLLDREQRRGSLHASVQHPRHWHKWSPSQRRLNDDSRPVGQSPQHQKNLGDRLR